ncbi:Uncharacterized protein YijF [hydrothermal vent metagenome]|uniref:Uncharacterized protein YijF n=1 Tax=hydrothermal vent metagenome TaxID=652676 RepID=A0A3B0Z3P5_9ZZZZ
MAPNPHLRSLLSSIAFLCLVSPASSDAGSDDIVPSFIKAAKERTTHDVTYDGSYFSIPYPGGDVPSNIGVCTDVVIRSFRQAGIDLQKNVHEDMSRNFHLYPSKRIWGLGKPDSNIDHRRVPNLRVFFERFGVSLQVTTKAEDYLPGDLVTWRLPGNLPHIGIVIDEKSSEGNIPLISHNIGNGPKISNMLFDYPITGHYRYPVN